MSDTMKAGAAVEIISPVESIELLIPTGMGRTMDTQGVLDDLRVEALAIENTDGLLIMLCSDLRIIDSEWAVQLRARIAEATGCDPRRIMFSAVHNHCSSPAVGRDSAESRAAVAAAEIRILDGFVNAAKRAVETLAPAELAAATTELTEPVGQNRRMLMDNGTCINGWGSGPMIAPGRRILGPAGNDSKRIDLLAARRVGEDKPFAVLSSYSSHPHLYQLPYFSGEFPGAVKREIESRIDGVIAMHTNACGGDIDLHCVHPMPDGHEEQVKWFQDSAAELGRRFGDAAVPAIESMEYSTCDAAPLVETNFDLAHINAVALGDIAVVTMPGEMFITFAEQMHERSPFANTIFMAYNGSHSGYIATELGFEQGSYEVMRGPRDLSDTSSPVRRATPTLGQEIADQVIELLGQLKK